MLVCIDFPSKTSNTNQMIFLFYTDIAQTLRLPKLNMRTLMFVACGMAMAPRAKKDHGGH